jgi:uncharacterized phage protein (TIGR01671 family)
MREIIFRGKLKDAILTRKKDAGDWVYGGFTPDAIGSPRITEKEGEGLLFHNIIPETVGQYTGLNDKNGVKIFERDIIRVSDYELDDTRYRNFAVVFTDGAYRLKGHDGYLIFISVFYQRHIEIIGNIYDNPELLKGGAYRRG